MKCDNITVFTTIRHLLIYTMGPPLNKTKQLMFDSFGFVCNLENFISKINKTLPSDEQEEGREGGRGRDRVGWASENNV